MFTNDCSFDIFSYLCARNVQCWAKKHSPSFDDLSAYVLQTHQTAQAGAIRAINQMATLRNWLIGCYIVEYEQEGRDRAKYVKYQRRCRRYLMVTKFVRRRRTNSRHPQMYLSVSMDNQLFVSTYMLQLPDKGTLEKFLLDEVERHSEYDAIKDKKNI